MYQENERTKVTIVAHSMGGPTILYFLTQSGTVNHAWKNKHIGNFIILSGTWSGGNLAIQSQISGASITNGVQSNIFSLAIFDNLADRIQESLIPVIRTLESVFFLFPRPSVWGNTVLVQTPSRNYTANDYQQLFSDISHNDGYAMYKGTEKINKNWPSPRVQTHCLYGIGVDTPLRFKYRQSFPEGANEDPQVIMGDGDGTVNIPSSEVCLQWANRNGGHYFKRKTFSNVDHVAMVSNRRVLREVGRIVGARRTPL